MRLTDRCQLKNRVSRAERIRNRTPSPLENVPTSNEKPFSKRQTPNYLKDVILDCVNSRKPSVSVRGCSPPMVLEDQKHFRYLPIKKMRSVSVSISPRPPTFISQVQTPFATKNSVHEKRDSEFQTRLNLNKDSSRVKSKPQKRKQTICGPQKNLQRRVMPVLTTKASKAPAKKSKCVS